MHLVSHFHSHFTHRLLDLGTHRVLIFHGESGKFGSLLVLLEGLAPARQEFKLDRGIVMSDNCRGCQIHPLVLEVIFAVLMLLKLFPQLQCFFIHFYAAPIFILLLLNLARPVDIGLGFVYLLLRDIDPLLRLHHLLLGESHGVSQFQSRL